MARQRAAGGLVHEGRVLGVDLRHIGGERAVQVDAEPRDLLRRDQLAQMQQELLRAFDGERGNDQVPAAPHRVQDDLGERVLHGLAAVVIPIPVRGLHHDPVRGVEQRGIRHDRHVPLAQVPGEHQRARPAVLADLDLQDGSAEDVPGGQPPHGDAVVQRERLIERHAAQQRDGALGVLHGVQGDLGVTALAAFARVTLGLVRRVLLLDVTGVPHDQGRQLHGGIGGPDRSFVAVPHEAGQEPHVIEVRVREQHDVQLGRIDRLRFPVAVQEGALLEHAAVHEKPQPAGFHVVAGSGHLTIRAEELQLHCDSPRSGPWASSGAGQYPCPGESVQPKPAEADRE